MSDRYLFTSESVSEGHPDKVADGISDAILDANLAQDPKARVACETLVSTGLVVVAGEITTKAIVNYADIAREKIRKIGYTDAALGFSADSCAIMVTIDRQSPDISQGVTAGKGLFKEQGAGDQGMMFGYACDETRELMPMPIMFSHRLTRTLAKVRKSGKLPFLRPDSKSQVTIAYENGQPVRVDTVVVSSQHNPEVSYKTLKDAIIEEVIKKELPTRLLRNTRYLINPTGRFVIGGPHGDSGLTGRKIIVDTYGGMGVTAAAPSRARIPPRWIAARPIWRVMWRRTLWRRDWPGVARSSWPMPSGTRSRFRFMSTRLAPARSRIH